MFFFKKCESYVSLVAFVNISAAEQHFGWREETGNHPTLIPLFLPANPMPRHRSVHRRGRRYDPIAGARSPCAEEHVKSVQEPQAAITTTSSVSRILARLEFEWGRTIYIRQDLQGTFHTYPHLGGPYQSLQEADQAIDRHLHDLLDPKMFRQQNDTSTLDLVIRQDLYWPDGTSKRSKSHANQKARDQMCQMAQALVDKYNEDHHLLGDLAYELKDVLNFNSISEHQSCYYHLNFNTNSKAANDSESSTSNIFFAEVKLLKKGEHRELLICCFCTVDSIINGQPCKACNNPDKFDIKHPDSSVELAAGHLDPRTQFSGFMREIDFHDSEDEDRYLRDAEAELRRIYKGLDDPSVIERLFTLPPGVTIVQD